MPPLENEIPGIIQIEITSRCNLSCPACPRSAPELRSKWISEDLPLHIFEKVLAETASENRHYHLQGWGEPLLNEKLPDLLDMISERGATASITTNATLLTNALAMRLLKAGLHSIVFSLGGGTAASHERNRPGTSLDRILDKIRMTSKLKLQMGKKRPRLVASFQMTRSNISTLSSAVIKVRKAGADSLTAINPILVSTEEQEKELVFMDRSPRQLKKVRRNIRRALWLSRLLSLDFYHEPVTERITPVCRENPLRNIYIGVRGDVSPCVFLNPPVEQGYPKFHLGRRHEAKRMIMGYAEDSRLLEIWKSSRYVEFRELFSNRQATATRRDPLQLFLPGEDNEASGIRPEAVRELECLPFPEPCQTCFRAVGF